MGLLVVRDFTASGWMASDVDARARAYCARLEAGDILMFTRTPFTLSDGDRAVLTRVRQSGSSYVKNISYRRDRDRLRGVGGGPEARRLHAVMRRYSDSVSAFAATFLRPYAERWQRELASFRAIEEEGRGAPPAARNDLLHIDSFPTRPMNGHRILRVFTNVHPTQPRVWTTTETFDVIAPRFAAAVGLGRLARRSASRRGRLAFTLRRWLCRLGLPVAPRPAYDQFMLRLHHHLKADAAFQENCPKFTWTFPPGATWLVFTDMVPHAVQSGRFAIEQTFVIPPEALVTPEKAPLSIAERLCGTRLTA